MRNITECIVYSVGYGWRGGATGRALDLRTAGRGFKSYSGQSCVTTLGKLFALMCLCHLVPAKGLWCFAAGKVTAGLAESNGSLPPGGWLIVTTCTMTACMYTVSAQDPTLGNDYGKPLPVYSLQANNDDSSVALGDVQTSCDIVITQTARLTPILNTFQHTTNKTQRRIEQQNASSVRISNKQKIVVIDDHAIRQTKICVLFGTSNNRAVAGNMTYLATIATAVTDDKLTVVQLYGVPRQVSF